MQLLEGNGEIHIKQEREVVERVLELWDEGYYLPSAIGKIVDRDRRTILKILELNGRCPDD